MKLHIVMHEAFEGPGSIETWAAHRGGETSYTRLYGGDTLPRAPAMDFLLVMGGPQSPATTPAECPHFDAKQEIAFLRRAVDANVRVVGICLGAQLLGEALGAPYEHSPQPEIGVFPVTLTEAGKRDPLLAGFPDTFPVGHWHEDMPGLTPGATVLATSPGCPRQMVRYTTRTAGLQCHFEFTRAAVDGLIEHGDPTEKAQRGAPYIQTAEQLRGADFAGMNKLLSDFLDRLMVA